MQLIEVTPRIFLELSDDQVFIGFQLIASSGPFFKGGIQLAFCLRQKLNYLRKMFLKFPSRASLLAFAKAIFTLGKGHEVFFNGSCFVVVFTVLAL